MPRVFGVEDLKRLYFRTDAGRTNAYDATPEEFNAWVLSWAEPGEIIDTGADIWTSRVARAELIAMLQAMGARFALVEKGI